MGKKNFVENYDPLKAHLTRDAEKSSAAPTAPSQPVASARPEVVPPREQREAAFSEATRDVERPRPAPASNARRKAASGDEEHNATRKVVPLQEPDPESGSPEMSARIKVSSGAFQDLEAMLSNVHRATGSKVHYSIATRALWGLLVQAEAQVIEEVRKASLGRLPSTRGRLEYAEYEERVRLAFANAFRKLPRSLFQTPAAEREAAAEG